ncbi:hypothetical protein K9M48_04860 [Candidatus Gracilibacteria bacterium]|nr:hypothetical protein [Candidatus Gracilibacteria bacterium]
MLNEKEFERLQKLACIKLEEEEKNKLFNQIGNIVMFLDKLNDLNLENNINIKQENNLRTISGSNNFENKEGLLNNVKHKKINNTIVIKSVLD